MQVEYRRDLQHSYLVVRMEKGQEAGYPLQMITKNKIPGLLECDCRRIDEDLLYYYDVTSRISLEERCRTRKITGKEVMRIVESLMQTLLQLEEYLLSPDELCIMPEYIFLDAGITMGEFCFIPGNQKPIGEGFRKLMEYCLPVLDHENQREAMAVYGLYHYGVQSVFSLEGLQEEMRKYKAHEEKDHKEEQREVLKYKVEDQQKEEEEREAEKRHEEALRAFFEEEEEKENHPAAFTAVAVAVILYFLCGWFLWKNYSKALPYWGGVGIFFVVTGILLWKGIEKWKEKEKETEETEEVDKRREEKDERKEEKGKREKEWRDEEKREWEQECTQLLHSNRQEGTYLLEEQYPQPGRRIILGGEEIQLVGSLEREVQIFIPSSTVSRLHARIRKRGDRYYLGDMNSRNGTWLNGQTVEAEQEIKLNPGDEVRFADHIYCFREL